MPIRRFGLVTNGVCRWTIKLGGHYPLWKLWAQHNEHRIPIMKALQLMDLSWFKGDRRPLLLLNWLIQTSLWGLSLISYMFVRRFSTAELATLAGITAFCVFNPNQMSLLSNTGSSSLK